MTDKQIIEDWLLQNKDKLPTVAYSEQVYKFIVATAHRIDDCYNVNGIWQRIEIKK
jgi:hypothetical protein